MNHHMTSRQRKRGSSSEKMKNRQRDRNYSTHSSMLACLQFNIVGELILNIGMGLIIPQTIPSLQCLLDLVTISMEGLMVFLEVQTGTLQAETLMGAITQIMGVKLEGTTAHHIHHKDVANHMGVACLLLVPEEPPVAMGLALQITPKAVNMEVLLLVELPIQWVLIEINSMVGNNKGWDFHLKLGRITDWSFRRARLHWIWALFIVGVLQLNWDRSHTDLYLDILVSCYHLLVTWIKNTGKFIVLNLCNFDFPDNTRSIRT